MGKNKKKNKISVVNKGSKNSNIKVEELEETTKDRPMKLRFSPTAWSKFLFMRDVGNTEVGGFALTMPDDLLYVYDFVLPNQKCSRASVEFDDESVADMTDDLIDEGLKPEQFLRIWIHTHPGMSASPSFTDEDTFKRVFGKCSWAIMAIVSTDGRRYCRLQVNGGPFPGAFEIPIEVDYDSYDFPASDSVGWAKEYEEKIEEMSYASTWKGYNPVHYQGGYMEEHNSIHGMPSCIEDEDRSVIEFASNEDNISSEIIGLDDDFINGALSLSDEILQHLSPNEMSLLIAMSPYERKYFLDKLKKKFKIGD